MSQEENLKEYSAADGSCSFTYREEEQGITVTQCTSCGEKAVIPGRIEEKPVIRIGEYAFSEQKALREAWLPFSVTRIDRHAFYNCRRLASVSLSAEAVEIWDGAFKNCEQLHTVVFLAVCGGNVCMKNILYDLEQDIVCEILVFGEADGAMRQEEPKERIRLLFPKNTYEYISNYAARIFHEVAYGSGYYYRQCAYEKRMDYARYDGLFDYASREERPELVPWLAFYRLRYPHELGEKARRIYVDWMRKHIGEFVRLLIEADDYEDTRYLAECDWVEETDFQNMIEAAGKTGNAEYISLFLAQKKKRFGIGKKTFEL